MPFDLGDTVRLTAECRDAGGALTDAASVTLTLTLPDGTATSPTVSAPATTGQYTYDYATTQPGRHSVRWVFATPACAYTDVFDVREAMPPLIISLADAKAHLNVSSSSNDEEIRGWVESVTASIEQFTGISVRRTISELHTLPPSGARAILLWRTPVLELTSIDGLNVADLTVDKANGIVRRTDGGLIFGQATATYVAGREVVPASLTSAAKIILQHLWRTQNGVGRASVVGSSDDFAVNSQVPGFGYAIPNRALQLLEPHRLPPGVA